MKFYFRIIKSRGYIGLI